MDPIKELSPGDAISAPGGDITLTVVETRELEVLFGTQPNIIIMHSNMPYRQWLHAPSTMGYVNHRRGVLLHLVVLSEPVLVGDAFQVIQGICRANDFHISGSGAYVREAYLDEVREVGYDGKGAILFPDEGWSLWEDTFKTKPDVDARCVPGVYHDDGHCGERDFNWVRDTWRAGRRIAIIQY